MASKGYYCLIQYCPDPGRAEVANVGVLVFCPELRYLDAAVSTNNRRVTRVFGRESFDSSWLKWAKQSFVRGVQSDRDRIRTLEDLEQFVSTRGSQLILTTPRAMRIEDAPTQLRELYKQWVEPTSEQLASQSQKLVPDLDATFRRLAHQRHTVKINQSFSVPHFEHTVRADYYYENGTANLIRLLSLDDRLRHTITQAVRLGGESVLVDKHLKPKGKNAQLVVVAATSSASGDVESLELLLRNLFDDYPAKLIGSREIDRFAERVESEAD